MSKSEAPHLHEAHHLLWECYTLTTPLGDEAFAGTDLTLALSGTLDMIGAWPGSTAAELARRGPKTQQAFSQLVNRLEKSGYVERRLGEGRGVELYLTAAGEAARADGHRREDELEDRLRATFGGDLYEEIVRVLGAARSALQAVDTDR